MSSKNKLNLDKQFDGIIYIEDQDITEDGKLNLPPPYNGKTTIVMLFATWCPPCKSTKPHFADLLEMVNDDVVVACINGSGDDTLESEQKLTKRAKKIFKDFKGFPHIMVFDKNGNMAKVHEGKRDSESMLKTIQQVN